MHKLFVTSTFAMTFLAVSAVSAATSTKPQKCYTGFESVKRAVEVISSVCSTAGTITSTTETVAPNSGLVGSDGFSTVSTVVSTCSAVATAVTKATTNLGPKEVSATATGRTFFFSDRAYYTKAELGDGAVKVSLTRDTTKKNGKAKMRVCVTSAPDASVFKDRKIADCNCKEVTTTTDATVSVDIASTDFGGIKGKHLFIVVDGRKGKVPFTLSIAQEKSSTAAATTPAISPAAAPAATPAAAQ